MEEDKDAFYVVRKGDVVGVYKSLSDCQAQAGSSVCDPSMSVYKGYSLPKEAEEYLVSRGLKNAIYSVSAVDVKEEFFGTLMPCPFQQPDSSKGKASKKDFPQKRSQEVLVSENLEVVGSTFISTDYLRKHAKLDDFVEAQAISSNCMDSQRNAYYTNRKYLGTNLGDQFLEASDQVGQHLNQPAHVFVQSSQPKTGSTTKKSQRGGNFTVEEDLLIVSAFLNVSLDAVSGNEQKRQTYWHRMYMFFQKHNKYSKRNQNSLMHRWSTIQLSTNKFCSCLAQIEAKHQSGLNEHDKIVKAKEMYRELNNNSPFQFEHCWNELRYQPKWLQESSQKKKQKKDKNKTPTSSCPFIPDSITLGEDDDSHDTFVDLERPPSRKAEKEQLNKLKGKGREDDYASSPLAGLSREIKEDKKQIQAERMEMYERTYLQDQEKLAIEQQKVRAERLKEEKSIMLMDTSAMPPMQAEYIRRLQMKIFEQGRT